MMSDKEKKEFLEMSNHDMMIILIERNETITETLTDFVKEVKADRKEADEKVTNLRIAVGALQAKTIAFGAAASLVVSIIFALITKG